MTTDLFESCPAREEAEELARLAGVSEASIEWSRNVFPMNAAHLTANDWVEAMLQRDAECAAPVTTLRTTRLEATIRKAA